MYSTVYLYLGEERKEAFQSLLSGVAFQTLVQEAEQCGRSAMAQSR